MELQTRLTELRRIVGETHRRLVHLQKAFDSPQDLEYWLWVNTHGMKDVPELRRYLLPVPPPEVYQHSNASDDWGYLLTAASTYRMVMEALAVVGVELEATGPVLDFGCGPGRGLRCFLRHTDRVEFGGCDIDERAIEWCKEYFPFGDFRVTGEHPPLPWPAESFGCVISVSVFSHLSEANHVEWLTELRRIMRPGAICILTIHGEHALARSKTEEDIFRMIEVSRESLQEASAEFYQGSGFGFIPQPTGHLTTDLYGVAFISRQYVEERWTEFFEVVGYKEAAIDNWQDVVILTAR